MVEREIETFRLPRSLYEELLREARGSLPNECCGLLGGRGRYAVRLFPATNELASPTAFEIPVRELFSTFRDLRAANLELVGIYHSHPSGDNTPSVRDRERAYYPEATYVIVSPQGGVRRPVRAFLFGKEGTKELRVEVSD